MAKRKKNKADRLAIPKVLQDIIPAVAAYPDGIIENIPGRYSKTFHFSDINYRTISRDAKADVCDKYKELINSFDVRSHLQITVNQRKIDYEKYKTTTLLQEKEDGLNNYREEYNTILTASLAESNMMYRECYITSSIKQDSYDNAKRYFRDVEADVTAKFTRLGSTLRPLDIDKRLHVIHDFYRSGEESFYELNFKDKAKLGNDFRAYICPDGCDISNDDYIKIGNRYARTLILRDLKAAYLKDDIITYLLSSFKNTSMLTLNIAPISPDDASRIVEDSYMRVEKNIFNWQQKQNHRKMFAATIPYDKKTQRSEIELMLEDINERGQHLFDLTITVIHTADTLEELNSETESFIARAEERKCAFSIMLYNQYRGLQATLPWGLNVTENELSRTTTSDTMCCFIPFTVQDIQDSGGNYYGINPVSGNSIFVDKTKLKNANMMILATPGAGKSMAAKNEVIYNLLADDDVDVIIIDPEREYSVPIKRVGGEVIKISASSGTHINAMDINRDYAIEEDNPVAFKSQFLMSVVEQVIGGKMTAQEKSVLDRCVRNTYRDYLKNNYEGDCPSLKELYEELLMCEEAEGHDLSLALELFVSGSLNMFSQPTNVNSDARAIVYDLYDMDEHLRPVGMLTVLDNILNRVTKNRFNGRKTVVIIEELYLYLMYPYTAEFFYMLWKRIRKSNGYCVGITQNVRDLRNSPKARTMLSNSELVILLSQAEDDIEDLRSLLHISEEEMQRVMDAEPGCGLMKIGKTILPFKNIIPQETELYKIMTSKPGEALIE